MPNLTVDEMISIQDLIDKLQTDISNLGLSFHVDDNLVRWKSLIEGAQGGTRVSKAMDPTINDLRPGNSFWVYLENDKAEIVSCQADRFIESEDFVQEFICTHRLFGDRLPTIDFYPLQLQEAVPVLSGRINFAGGTWVRPDHRGQGLSGLMSRMARMLALRHFEIDYHLGFIEATDSRRRYGKDGLGLKHRRHLLSGRYPGRDRDMNMDIHWISREDILAQIFEELAA